VGTENYISGCTRKEKSKLLRLRAVIEKKNDGLGRGS
jgi:hypothetical protein